MRVLPGIDVYPDGPTWSLPLAAAPWPWSVGAIGAVLVALGRSDWAAGVAGVYLLGSLLVSLILRGRRRSLTLTRRGLTEHIWAGRDRRHPWASVLAVRETEDGFVVDTADGAVPVSSSVWDAAELGARLSEALGRRLAAEGPPLPDQQLAERLGIGLDEELSAIIPTGQSLWLLSVAVTTAVAIGGVLIALPPVPQPWLPRLAAGFAMAAWALLYAWGSARTAVLELHADVGGLVLRRPARSERLAWPSIRGCERQRSMWRLRTARGDVLVPAGAADVDRLAEAVQRVCAARDEGFALPAAPALTARALSRLGPEAAEDRALSVVPGESAVGRGD